MKKSKKTAARLAQGALWILCIVLCALLAYQGISYARGDRLPLVFGWGKSIVGTGSMEPEIPAGSLILVHRQEAYSAGDVICFRDSYGNIVAHRIVALDGTGSGLVQTQGDANNTADKPITDSQIIGRVVAVSPAAGNLVRWTQSNILWIALCVALLAAIWYTARQLYRNGRKQDSI